MKNNAFTLIELMIVVAIIAFLASMAIPQYFKYFAKSRQVEVSMILASLHTAQQVYWAEHGTYNTALSGTNGIGWQPEGYNGGGKNASFNYTYGFNVSGAKEGIHYFTGKLGAPKSTLGDSYATKEGFLVKAAGDILSKNKMDIWSIDQTRAIKHEQNGID